MKHLLLAVLFFVTGSTALADKLPANIQQALQAVTWDEVQLHLAPSLRFISAESIGVNNTKVTNRIQLDQSPSFDLWRMRQQSSGEGANYTSWSYVVIVVDKQSRPYKSYYFEFKPQPVTAPQKWPQPIAPRFDCSRCHPSGPRLIRPTAESQKRFTAADNKLLTQWNQVITSYGVVTSPQQAPFLSPQAREELTLPFCSHCHDSTGVIRASLTRHHRGSIEFLVKNGAMPKADETNDKPHFTAKQRQCLADWLKNLPLANDCQEVVTKPKGQASDTLSAAIETSWGEITAQAPAPQEARLTCSQPQVATCELRIVSRVRDWQTGIVLRDEHLATKVFAAAQHPLIEIVVSGIAPDLYHQGFNRRQFQVQVTAGGKQALHTANVSCTAVAREKKEASSTCTLHDLSWDLKRQGLQAPRLFGLPVLPVSRLIHIKGTFHVGQ